MEIKHAEKQQKFETGPVPWSVLPEIGISRATRIHPVGHLRIKHFNETAKSKIKEYERRIEEVITLAFCLWSRARVIKIHWQERLFHSFKRRFHIQTIL